MDISSWNCSTTSIQKDLKTLDISLRQLSRVPDDQLMSPEELLSYFETREANQEPDAVDKKLLAARTKEEKDFEAFQKKLELKKKAWNKKKMRYVHESHVAVAKTVCLNNL